MLHLIDVSAYQPKTVPVLGQVLMVKATEGSAYTSSTFSAQWAGAAHWEARVAYHFARPEESSAISQADRFLAVVKPKATDALMLDMEASKLSQAATNAWAKAFLRRLREKAPHCKIIGYLGSAYATNGTGKGLAAEFDFWMYPQYPAGLLRRALGAIARLGRHPRAAGGRRRGRLSATVSTWPSKFAPWLPKGLTIGKSLPDIWQFTAAYKGKYDASVSNLTAADLTGDGPTPSPAPDEEDYVSAGVLQSRNNIPNKRSELTLTFKAGDCDQVGIWGDPTYDNPAAGYPKQAPATFRVIAHTDSRKGHVFTDDVKGSPTFGTEVITVGWQGADGKGWTDKWVGVMPAGQKARAFKVTRLDYGDDQYGSDCSHTD
jgi:hypothetical protein